MKTFQHKIVWLTGTSLDREENNFNLPLDLSKPLKIHKIICFFFFIILESISCLAQEPGLKNNMQEAKNVLYVNPVHLASKNYTFSFERFTSSHRSYKIMLSGGEKENYVAASVDLNLYPFRKSSMNYFTGLSIMGFECPLEAGVPVSKPVNEFFEGHEDQYSISLQCVNGVLLKLFSKLYFGIDGKIGPEYNFSEKKFGWMWSININLGIPFE